MSWIKELDKDNAENKLRDIYCRIEKERGKLSNIMKVHSLNPHTMESHMDLYMDIMFKNRSLSREECELIAVVVSTLNECDYCIKHHYQALDHYWKDKNKIDEFTKTLDHEDLNHRESKIIDYTKKLTDEPGKVTEEDIENLKNIGLTDEEILNINLVVSYFNFVNRIALGLGVEFSKEEMKGYEY